eukprot:4177639-Alexandrium_andersonii.AAC.1
MPSRAPAQAAKPDLVVDEHEPALNPPIKGVGYLRVGRGGRRRLGPRPAISAGGNDLRNEPEGRIGHTSVLKDTMH